MTVSCPICKKEFAVKATSDPLPKHDYCGERCVGSGERGLYSGYVMTETDGQDDDRGDVEFEVYGGKRDG